jgi:hypothetical protein
MAERTTSRQQPTEEYAAALAERADRWVPACGGHEEAFLHNGTRYLYVWNPATEEHAYLNLDTDMPVEGRAPWEAK